MAFGASLKRERELRGISLEEISSATKISVRLLSAIETDRYDILPEGIFRKSFIKNYAKYLGMNEDKILQEYALATQTASPPSFQEKLNGNKSGFHLPGRYFRWVIPGLIAILVVGAIYWHFSGPAEREQEESVNRSGDLAGRTAQKRPSPTSNPIAATPSTSAVSSGRAATSTQSPSPPSASSSGTSLKVLGERAKQPEPVTAVSQNPTQAAPETAVGSGSPPGELTLGINATEECWLSVSSGDAPLYAGLLQPEQQKRFPIQKPLKLTFGNAGGVKLSVNGKPLTSVGKMGEVRVLEINPENYQNYLATSQ